MQQALSQLGHRMTSQIAVPEAEEADKEDSQGANSAVRSARPMISGMACFASTPLSATASIIRKYLW